MALGLVMMVADLALANTIVIPFFNDAGSLGGTTPARMRTFVRVKNLDDATIECAVTYTDMNGIDCTPTPNTFLLGPKQTMGFRPGQDDPVAEDIGGVTNPVPNAAAIEGSTFEGAETGAGPCFGGMEIITTGRILGMVSQEDYFVGAAGGSGVAPAVEAPAGP